MPWGVGSALHSKAFTEAEAILFAACGKCFEDPVKHPFGCFFSFKGAENAAGK